MVEVDTPPIGIIPIHFDVPNHHIPLDTFIRTATQTRAIIESFNKHVFHSKLRYSVVVLPPEDGSFIARLGIILGVGYAVWTFAESDMGKAFVKGLTKYEPAYWLEQIGSNIRDAVVDDKDENVIDVPKSVEKKTLIGRFETKIVTESTKSFLQNDQKELKKVPLTTENFGAGFQARNEFYQACLENERVSGIGFEEINEFPITRHHFTSLQVVVASKEDSLIDRPWEVETVVLKVTSPNWDKEDRSRQWKARDGNDRERFFHIDDDHFWELVAKHELNTQIIDTIKVQWAYIGDRRNKARVLRVLEYNDHILNDCLDDSELFNRLGSYEHKLNDQPDFFDKS